MAVTTTNGSVQEPVPRAKAHHSAPPVLPSPDQVVEHQDPEAVRPSRSRHRERRAQYPASPARDTAGTVVHQHRSVPGEDGVRVGVLRAPAGDVMRLHAVYLRLRTATEPAGGVGAVLDGNADGNAAAQPRTSSPSARDWRPCYIRSAPLSRKLQSD